MNKLFSTLVLSVLLLACGLVGTVGAQINPDDYQMTVHATIVLGGSNQDDLDWFKDKCVVHWYVQDAPVSYDYWQYYNNYEKPYPVSEPAGSPATVKADFTAYMPNAYWALMAIDAECTPESNLASTGLIYFYGYPYYTYWPSALEVRDRSKL